MRQCSFKPAGESDDGLVEFLARCASHSHLPHRRQFLRPMGRGVQDDYGSGREKAHGEGAARAEKQRRQSQKPILRVETEAHPLADETLVHLLVADQGALGLAGGAARQGNGQEPRRGLGCWRQRGAALSRRKTPPCKTGLTFAFRAFAR